MSRTRRHISESAQPKEGSYVGLGWRERVAHSEAAEDRGGFLSRSRGRFGSPERDEAARATG